MSRVAVREIEHAGRTLYRLYHVGTKLEFPVEFSLALDAEIASQRIDELTNWDEYVENVRKEDHQLEHTLWLAILNIAGDWHGNRIGSTHNACLDWQSIRLKKWREADDAPLSE